MKPEITNEPCTCDGEVAKAKMKREPVYHLGVAYIDPGQHTDDLDTGLTGISCFGVTLQDMPRRGGINFLTAKVGKNGLLIVSGWMQRKRPRDILPAVGGPKGGTGYSWWAIGAEREKQPCAKSGPRCRRCERMEKIMRREN